MNEVVATEIDGRTEPWVAVEAVCSQYGLQYPSAKHAIAEGRFPVPTYKVGRKLVIDKAVHVEYFKTHRAAGLHALKNNQML